MFEPHQANGASNNVCRFEQDEAAVLAKQLPMQLDEQPDASAVDETNLVHFEQTMLANGVAPDLGIVLDLFSAENFRHAQALPGRFADNNCGRGARHFVMA